MSIENSAEVLNFVPEMSTDSICVGENDALCLTDHLEAMENDIAAKALLSHTHAEYLSEDDAVATFAMASHTHSDYMTEDDAVAAFALASHTHTGYAASEHTHTDLATAIETLDTGKADATHTHAQADITGLVDKLAEIDEAIEALQASGGSSNEVTPLYTLSMHLGKLDNNSGAEVSSSTRICSDPFAVESGKSYWQVNDNAVNMYVLLYDADEVFLEYLGNFASGAEIAVSNADAAYMRLGSLLGEYDLTNNFYIYDTDPAGGAVEEETFTQADADLLYAPISHTHSEYAAAEHTHDYAAADHTHTGFAATEHTHDGYATTDHTHTADDITGLPSSVDAYSKTESDAKYALADHTHALDTHDIVMADDSCLGYVATETLFDALELLDTRVSGKASTSHIHSDYLTEDEAADAFASISHTHTPAAIGAAAASHTHDYAASSHTHTPASIGAAAASHTHDYADADHTHSDYAAATHTHSEYAAASHSHSGYAASGHTHTASDVGAAAASHTHTAAAIGAASASHSHSEYAASNHGHSDYASTSHTHTASDVGAVPSSGGTATNLTVTPYLYTAQILPKDTGSYSIGSSDYRYYSTYLKANPNVSSDRRCKRDIETMDIEALAAFVDKLPVVSYNYNDDDPFEAKRIGLVAQDVVAADPEIAKGCIEQDAKGFYSLRAADLVFPLIAAVQALTKRVEDLENK